jgi:hypothetical protein
MWNAWILNFPTTGLQPSERKKSELQTSRWPMEANHIIELTLVLEPTARGVE